MTRKATWAAGAFAFLVFLVALAPATLIRHLLPDGSGLELVNVRGSLWNGSGELYASAMPLGSVVWDHRAVTILQGALGYDLHWSGPDHDVTGSLRLGLRRWHATASGALSAGFVNRWLQPYDIAVGGDLALQEVALTVPYAWRGEGIAAGTARWDGGPVRYRLANQAYDGLLPPLTAFLGDGLEAVVYPESGQTPLLRAQVQPNGFVRIGLTQMMTRLLDNPWPGSHPDHEVVLEVEEQLF